ncbi:MAG TPA: GAF and ANTAR domain-containing protein [Mycobacteriales bacterium]
MDASWEERLAKTFVQLADTLVSGFDLPEFLRMLARRSRELLDVTAVELMVAGPHGELHLVGDSAAGALPFEVSRPGALGDGPGPECLRTGRAVAEADLATAVRRWPHFVEAAVAVGYRCAHALPMRLREDVIGAATLLHNHPGSVDEPRLRVGQSLVDVATIGILQQRAIDHDRKLAGQLHNALTSRVPIEQAKGVLSERLGVGMDEAFAVLRGHARNHNRRLTEVARRIVDGLENLVDPPNHTADPPAGQTAGPASAAAGSPASAAARSTAGPTAPHPVR